MRVYVNKRKELILAPDYFDRYGGVSNETIQVKDGGFTAEIEKEVQEAMQEIIERWQPMVKDLPLDVLFAERQKQVRSFSDFETVLTELVEEEYGR